MPFARRFLLLVAPLFLVCGVSFAQVPTGTPPFGSFGGGPDVINLASLNSHISIPVIHKAGRGLNFTYDMSYDSSVWYPVNSGGTTSWQPVYNWGWRGQTETATGYVSYSLTQVNGYPSPCYTKKYNNFVYHDAWGVAHSFNAEGDWYNNPQDRCGTCGTGVKFCFYGFSSIALDGSGYTLFLPNGPFLTIAQLYGRDGKVTNPPQGSGTGSANFTDRNGNFISIDGSGHFYDTLSSTIAALTVGSTAPPSSTTFTYTAPSGTSASYTMKYGTYTVQTNYGCSGVSEFGPTSEYLVSEIDLPDNSKYTFTYEGTPGHSGNVTGRLASVTLPTGGTITYTYTGGSSGHITCSDGSASGLTRQIYDGTNTNTWTYARTPGSGAASTDTITDPLGNQTILQFQGIYETQRQAYQGTSTLLGTVYTCYNGSASPCTGTAISLPISSQTVTTILPGSANLQSKVVTSYNSYGQLSEEDDYGYGSGAPGSLLRKKLITIQTVGTYQAIQTAQIQDGSGNVKAQTTMTFDQGSVTATSGTPQHSNPTVGRGNPTTISYLVQGSTSLTKTLTYYDTGTVNTATDFNGAQTTNNYGTGSCGNAFPTSISEPLSLSQSMAWNCTGGVATSATDENTKTVSTSYTDTQFWRPNSTTDQVSNVTNLTYNGQTSVESAMNFNSNSSTSDKRVTLDGLGRIHITQTRQSPGSTSYDSVETDYDVVGRPYRTTTPYSGTAGQTTSGSAPATITTYDALGRVLTVTDAGNGTVTYTYSQNDVYQTLGPAPTGENAKRRQSEYDSLGRLTSVCEVTAGTTQAPAGICGQNSSATGYWTKYTYDANGNLTGVTQNAQAASGQQTRSYSYDDLSRMTSETNPESGVKTYAYDSLISDPNCGTVTYSGDLVKWTDAVGNIACNTYDLLHRNTSVTYNGTYASNTPKKYFVYDSATVNSVAMANAKTRLAEAYTCFSPCSSKITDLGLSYTARGEVSDEYESTPNSGAYYHSAASYWANGVINTLSGAGTYSTSYGLDGEGRISSAGGGTQLASTTYNTSNQPTAVNFASGDSDNFTYDPNTGRMTQYKFNVGSQAVTGALTWNAIGTLGNLAITDPFNSSNAQNCTYAHDDLVRISSANCGSIWSQTFTYADAFGNLSKSGSSSFSASYSPSTNRMTTIGSSTPTYDGNGNVTNDFLHTYAWDANGRPVTIDGVGVTYDALGRAVELNNSGVHTEMQYSPTGFKMVLMNGQTFVKAFVPLPAGTAEVWTASANYYRHSDWLGSARLTTTQSRTVYGDVAYAPFGETYAQSGTADSSFTGMNQDTVSNEYDFPAREYGIQGRWPSPDPAGLGAVDPANPQSWNRYAYVENNPLAMTDPSGMDPCPNDPTNFACVYAPPPDPIGLGDGSGGGGGSGFGTFFTPGSCAGSEYCGAPPSCYKLAKSYGYKGQEVLDFCNGVQKRQPAKPQTPQKPPQTYQQCVQNGGTPLKVADMLGLYGIGSLAFGAAETGLTSGLQLMYGRTAANLGAAVAEQPPITTTAGFLADAQEHALALEGTFSTLGKLSGYVTLGATAVSLGYRAYCGLTSQ